MRPLDVIREGLDSGVMVHQQFLLCEILDSKIVQRVGLIVKARPIHEKVSNYKNTKPGKVGGQPEGNLSIETYSAVCINRPPLFWDMNIKTRFNALLLSIQKDSLSSYVAILVPKTFVDPFDPEVDEESKKYFMSKRGDMVQEK